MPPARLKVVAASSPSRTLSTVSAHCQRWPQAPLAPLARLTGVNHSRSSIQRLSVCEKGSSRRLQSSTDDLNHHHHPIPHLLPPGTAVNTAHHVLVRCRSFQEVQRSLPCVASRSSLSPDRLKVDRRKGLTFRDIVKPYWPFFAAGTFAFDLSISRTVFALNNTNQCPPKRHAETNRESRPRHRLRCQLRTERHVQLYAPHPLDRLLAEFIY